MPAAEWKAIWELRHDDDIKILHADKGYATVVTNTPEYDSKVHKILDDSDFPIPLNICDRNMANFFSKYCDVPFF